MTNPAHRSRGIRRRKGAATIVAVSFLVIIALLLAAMSRLLKVSRDQSQLQLQALESEWMVEAGQQQAQRELAIDPEYAGESWTLESMDEMQRSVTILRNNEKNRMFISGKIKRGKRTVAGAVRSIPLSDEVNNEEN